MQIPPTVKKVLSILIFGTIMYFIILFIISTGIILLVVGTIGLAIFGAYCLLRDVKIELIKKEENFDNLKKK